MSIYAGPDADLDMLKAKRDALAEMKALKTYLTELSADMDKAHSIFAQPAQGAFLRASIHIEAVWRLLEYAEQSLND